MSRHGYLAPLAASAVFNTMAFGSLVLWARRYGARKHPGAALRLHPERVAAA